VLEDHVERVVREEEVELLLPIARLVQHPDTQKSSQHPPDQTILSLAQRVFSCVCPTDRAFPSHVTKRCPSNDRASLPCDKEYAP
jgi:hypothetical protein